jgi:hypothetical protein
MMSRLLMTAIGLRRHLHLGGPRQLLLSRGMTRHDDSNPMKPTVNLPSEFELIAHYFAG